MSLLGLPLNEEKLAALNAGIDTQVTLHDTWFDLLFTIWKLHVLRKNHSGAKLAFEQIWEMKKILQGFTDDI
jgi:hypothetical protein